MELPIFCHLLGVIKLKEVSVGTVVYDAINAELSEEDEPFTYDMTGTQLYVHYKHLTPASRLAVGNLTLLTKEQWRELTREVETLRFVIVNTKSKKSLYSSYSYGAIIVFCYMVSGFIIAGFLANLKYNDEEIHSKLVETLYEVTNSLAEEEDLNND